MDTILKLYMLMTIFVIVLQASDLDEENQVHY